MSEKSWKAGRDIIAFITSVNEETNNIIHAQKNHEGKPLKTACIVDKSKKRTTAHDDVEPDILIEDDFKSTESILKALLPYRERFLGITCRGEVNIESFIKVIPHLPYLRTPSESSLSACIDKIAMRKLLRAYDKKITPKFTVVHDSKKETIENIENKVGYPLVIKPASLAASLLVSICYHREELETELRRTLRKINSLYKERGMSKVPQILVEQFMEGDMYSIDCYISSRGKIEYTPLVRVQTGRSIGFDDFFGYSRITPTTLSKTEIAAAQAVSKSCIHAIGLRNSTAHIELMKTDSGWKIIEMGARMGGYRHIMYQLSYGINHALNDVYNRIPYKFSVPTKVKSHTAVLEFFAREEGHLTKISGVRRAQKLASMKKLNVYVKEGEMCTYAKHGGKRVISAVLSNPKRPNLLADIRRLEKMIVIETSKKAPKKAV